MWRLALIAWPPYIDVFLILIIPFLCQSSVKCNVSNPNLGLICGRIFTFLPSELTIRLGGEKSQERGKKDYQNIKRNPNFTPLTVWRRGKKTSCSTVPDTAVLPYARCFFPLLTPYNFSVFSPSNSGIWILETAFFSRMNVSHASVHPVEDPPPTDAINAPRVRMKDFQGTPGTTGGLSLRCCQFLFAAIALCVMVTTSDFSSVTAFW